MLYDIATVLTKELKEILHLRESVRSTILSIFIPVFCIGFFFSVNSGIRWVQSYLSLIIWFMLSFVTVVQIVADSFAGERERHTLETLLATRLGEFPILMGKIGAAVMYGFTLACAGIILGLITVSVTSGEGHLLMFPLPVLIAGILTGILSASTTTLIGILFSLRASSARKAQQTLGFAMLFFFMSPVLIAYLLPEKLIHSISSGINAQDSASLIIPLVMCVIALDLILFAIIRARFKRQKMCG